MSAAKLFTFFALFSLASAQDYLMEVVQYNHTLNQTTFRCAGAFFANASIITPANCLDDIPEGEFFIRTTTINQPDSWSRAMFLNLRGYRQNPYYNRSDLRSNNIGIAYHPIIDSLFVPRSLSQVRATPSLCLLHGLLERNGSHINYFDDPITVLSPEQCLSEDSHTFCAVFDTLNNPTCDFDYGSPITCDGSTVAGFLASENGCEMNWVNNTGTMRQAPMLRFTSMSLYHEWMALEDGSTTPGSATSIQLAKFGILAAFIIMILVNFHQ